MNIFTLMGTIMVDNSAANESISSTGQAAEGLVGKITTGVDKVGSFCDGVGTKMTSVGTNLSAKVTVPIAALGAGIIKVSSDFEAGMSQVAATMGITTDEIRNGSESFTKLQEAAKQAGATTQFSATQASEALNYLALAGYDADKACEALPKVLNLAAAGGLELGYAADLVTDSMSALGLEMKDLDTFMDAMAKTAQKSNTSVGQLGEATLTVGGTAKTLSGGLTEMNTALGILADNGIKGSEGGTALRNVILSLTAPTDKARGMLDELGISVSNADGSMRKIEDIMWDLNGALGTLGTTEKQEVLNTIFNKVDLKSVSALMAATTLNMEGLSSVLGDMGIKYSDHSALINQIATDYNTLDDRAQATQWIMEDMGVTMEEANTIFDAIIEGCGEAGNRYQELSGYINEADGACADMAETMNDNLAGQLTILKSSLEGVAIQLGEILLPYAKKVVEVIQNCVTWFANLSSGTQSLIVGIAGLAAAIGPVLVVVGSLATGISTLSSIVSASIGFFTAGASGVSAFSTVLAALTGPVGIAVAAISGVIAILIALYNTNEEARATIEACWEAIKEAFSSACDLIMSIINAFIDAFKDLWQRYGEEILEIINAALDAISETFKVVLDLIQDIFKVFSAAFKGDWQGLWQALKDLASNLWNNIKDALKAWLDTLVTTIVNIGLSMLDAGKTIFTKLWDGIKSVWESITNWINQVKEDPVQAFLNLGSAMWNAGKSLFMNLWDGIKSVWNGICNWVEDKVNWIKDKVTFWNNSKNSMSESSVTVNGSHRTGLDRVPFDGYIAELHKGERVLTKEETDKYENQQSTTIVTNTMDISRLETLTEKLISTVDRLPRQMQIHANMA